MLDEEDAFEPRRSSRSRWYGEYPTLLVATDARLPLLLRRCLRRASCDVGLLMSAWPTSMRSLAACLT